MFGISCHNKSLRLPGSNTSSSHHFGNPVSGYYPTACFQLFCHPRATIGLITSFKNAHDLCQKFFILLPAEGWTTFQLLIIAAFSHLKYFAHLLNGKSGAVIAYKLIDFPSLLEKMLTAFFKISLSILASRSSLLSLATSLSRSVIFGFPLPGKLFFSYRWYSLRHRYNNSGRIPNSSAISLALPRANESSTAFCLKSRSYFCLFLIIMANYFFFCSLTCRPGYWGIFTNLIPGL